MFRATAKFSQLYLLAKLKFEVIYNRLNSRQGNSSGCLEKPHRFEKGRALIDAEIGFVCCGTGCGTGS
jgi:hypothetical protein